MTDFSLHNPQPAQLRTLRNNFGFGATPALRGKQIRLTDCGLAGRAAPEANVSRDIELPGDLHRPMLFTQEQEVTCMTAGRAHG